MFRRTSQADLSMGGNITPETPASRNTNLSSPVLKNSCRCLDAAHGKAARTVVVGQRVRHVRTETQPGTVRMPRRIGRRSPRIAATADVVQGSRPLGAVARSRRCKAIARRNAAEGAEQWFLLRMSMRLLRTECRAQPAGHACGPPLREAAAHTARRVERRQRRNHPPGPTAIVPPRQPYFVILNGAKNLFPCEPKAADGLCLARRRETNEVQSRIYFGQGYRFFVGR